MQSSIEKLLLKLETHEPNLFNYKQELKEDIERILRDNPTGSDLEQNILILLINDDEVDVAMAILRQMALLEEWHDYVQIAITIPTKNGIGILLEAAKVGQCRVLDTFISDSHVKTLLDIAEKNRQTDDVKFLKGKNANLLTEIEGYTPLHMAAISTRPSNKILQMLLNGLDHYARRVAINGLTAKDNNTALHLAAGNANTTTEFLQALMVEGADPSLTNAEGDTAFHVAAKAQNDELFVALLDTFFPTKRGEIIVVADCGSLIDICTRNCSVKGVVALIEHGVDISTGVLNTVADESLKNPTKTGSSEVLKAVIDNVVLWKCTNDNIRCPLKGSTKYRKIQSEVIQELITNATEDISQHIASVFEKRCNETSMASELEVPTRDQVESLLYKPDKLVDKRHKIEESLTQENPLDSVLKKLITIDDDGKQYIQDALSIVKRMTKIDFWKPHVKRILSKSNGLQSGDGRGNGIMHEAANFGRCQMLREFMTEENVRVLNVKKETPLHFAAYSGHVDDIQLLISKGANITDEDSERYTPLHMATISPVPLASVVKYIVSTIKKYARNDDGTTFLAHKNNKGMTALHLAAGNVNATAELIEELRDINPLLKVDSSRDTAFHIAASSKNSQVILWMLKTFSSAWQGWDIDNVDSEYTLLNICARNGNAEAVASLIQHGADISSSRVLYTIIKESVKNPSQDFADVYRAIVENAVIWRCLEENKRCPAVGSRQYNDMLNETMMFLLTQPFERKNQVKVTGLPTTKTVTDDQTNVICKAIKLGASEMLKVIINTEGVFRKLKEGKYDLTGWQKKQIAEVNQQEILLLNVDEESSWREQRFLNKYIPATPYLQYILRYRDLWLYSDILSTTPFKELADLNVVICQTAYFFFFCLHLMIMIIFTAIILPDTEELKSTFGLTAKQSNMSMDLINTTPNEEWITSSPALGRAVWFCIALIFVWATIISVSILRDYKLHSWHAWIRRSTNKPKLLVFYKLFCRVMSVLFGDFAIISFCFSAFFWCAHRIDPNVLYTYLLRTAMVLLFGWIVVFTYVSRVFTYVYVFYLVLKDILWKDILLRCFAILFSTFLGFSFALYVLRLTTLPAKTESNNIYATLYDVFLSALTLGEFFQEATVKDKVDLYVALGGQPWVFRLLFGVYVSVTALILINLLIAMMNNRYSKAKEAARAKLSKARKESCQLFRAAIKVQQTTSMMMTAAEEGNSGEGSCTVQLDHRKQSVKYRSVKTL